MTLATTILSLFAARDTVMIDVPMLQPADPFLDIAGEDLRRRIFLTESETGETLCLRPEFTIPVCLDHIRNRAETPRRYAYLGEVFRQRRDGEAEFFQAGIEDLGDPRTATADARSLADAHALLAMTLPGTPLSITLGDQTVFEAVLAALGLPRGWQKRLARAFGSKPMLEQALADLAQPPPERDLGGELHRLATAGDRAALAAFVAAQMQEAGISPSAGRTPDEIARRLIEKAELSRLRLTSDQFEALRSFLAIRVPLAGATDALAGFGRRSGVALDGALSLFSARSEAILAHGLPGDAIDYDAGFGRPLDYYTGVVFEIAAPGDTRPLVGGGRYDRLLTLLGADRPIPGVGFSVWLDRIERAREGRT